MSIDFSGARGSNAGDSFHELWALRQALSLLAPDTTLSAVTVEGIAADVQGKGPPWHSVDCGLLHGGTQIEAADCIELVQLKYSASEPTTPWTLARMDASPGKADVFLASLDLTECGTTTRFAEEEALILAIAGLREGTALTDLSSMLDHIGRRGGRSLHRVCLRGKHGRGLHPGRCAAHP